MNWSRATTWPPRPRKRRCRALKAGVDIETPDAWLPDLAELVKEKRIAESEIDAVVRRILELKFQAGLFEQPYVDAKARPTPDRHAGRDRAGARSGPRTPVLLKNDKGLLPLNGKKVGKVLLLGTHAKDTRSAAIPTCRATWSRSTKACRPKPRRRASRWRTRKACASPRAASGAQDEIKFTQAGSQRQADRRGGGSGQVGRHHRHGPGRQRADQPRSLGRQPPGRPRQRWT
jgi:beta-glucosidase-like glycosyl hydrolase